MPLSATLEEIKAYQEKVEKNKITPYNLPPCPICHISSDFFKIHAYRERRFLIIIEMIVEAVFCTLVRFGCPGCGKTFTNYPDFAIPHKHYTVPSIVSFAAAYVQSDEMTYQQAIIVDKEVPGYAKSNAMLTPSTVHRWVTTLSGFARTCRIALILLVQDNPLSPIHRNLAGITVSKRKFRSDRRRSQLVCCTRLLITEIFFTAAFSVSIFTNLAINNAFR